MTDHRFKHYISSNVQKRKYLKKTLYIFILITSFIDRLVIDHFT